ncbi:hypothetical protein CON37_31605, partial [Bacillus cereus]
MTVTFENKRYDVLGFNSLVKIKTDRWRREFSTKLSSSGPVTEAKDHYKYLGAGLNAEGIELR